MTLQEMRVAIAEDQGWKFVPSCDRMSGVLGLTLTAMPEYWQHEDGDIANEPPNYPSDLNACHEFEEKMTPLDHQHFCLFLHKLIMGTMDNFDINGTCNLECISRVVKATAAQRCEAYCQLKGWWK